MTRGRVTVTDPGMGDSMTVTPGAGGTWCAGPTTASSSGLIIMRRMTAVRELREGVWQGRWILRVLLWLSWWDSGMEVFRRFFHWCS